MKEVSETTVERARQLMLDGAERSRKSVAEALGVAPTSGSSAMGVLHDRGLIYVVRYVVAPGNNRRFAIYRIRLADEQDAPVPKAFEKNERRASIEREWLRQARASGKVVFRDPLVAAFFGECEAVKPAKLERRIVKQDMTGERLNERRKAA